MPKKKSKKQKDRRTDPRKGQRDRMLRAYDYLRSHNFVETTDDVALRMGVNRTSVRSALSRGGTYMSLRLIDSFLGAFEGIFSRDWLVDGVGEMLADGEVFSTSPHPTRSDRVSHLMEQEGLTYGEMTKEIGLSSASTLFRITRYGQRPQDGTLDKILERYPKYSRDWLYAGVGPMLAVPGQSRVPEHEVKALEELDEETAAISTAIPYVPSQTMRFPLVEDPAVAGTLTSFGDPDPEGVRMIEVPVDRPYRGTYRIFTIRGDSMDDGTSKGLAEGDRVLARSVDRDYWLDGLHTRDWLYFIFVTRTEGIVIKQVVAQDPARGLFRLHSLNPFYHDFDLHVSDVVAIYNVIEIVSRRLTV